MHMVHQIQQPTLTFSHALNQPSINPMEIYERVQWSEAIYPGFQDWFFHKVIPGCQTGDRKIVVKTVHNEIAGLFIVKQTVSETKLCSLHVFEPFQGRGIGLRLFEEVFYILDNRKPFFTVSEIRLPSFKRLFDYFGFQRSRTVHSCYVPGIDEHFYNEEN